MRRVSVVGNSGSGKSRLARRIATSLGVAYVELDAIHHLPEWEPIDPVAFDAAVREVTAADGWVVDGNYRRVVAEGPVWERADTVVWLDLPRRVVVRQVVLRTLRRVVSREELWNGNREPLSNLWSWDPERSVVAWAWTRHHEYRARYDAAMRAPMYAHLAFVRLRSRREVRGWLETVARTQRGGATRTGER